MEQLEKGYDYLKDSNYFFGEIPHKRALEINADESREWGEECGTWTGHECEDEWLDESMEKLYYMKAVPSLDEVDIGWAWIELQDHRYPDIEWDYWNDETQVWISYEGFPPVYSGCLKLARVHHC